MQYREVSKSQNMQSPFIFIKRKLVLEESENNTWQYFNTKTNSEQGIYGNSSDAAKRMTRIAVNRLSSVFSIG